MTPATPLQTYVRLLHVNLNTLTLCFMLLGNPLKYLP